jgi:hypothetical protein
MYVNIFTTLFLSFNLFDILRVAQRVRSLDLTTHTSLSPIRRGFAHSFVNDNKECTRLTATSDKVYQLLAHGRWFSPGTPASSTTKTCRHDIAEILLKLALSTKIQIQTQIYLSFLKAIHNTLKMRIVSTKFIITITGSKCAYIYIFFNLK